MIRILIVAIGAVLSGTSFAETEWRGGSPEDRAAIAAIIETWKQAYATGNGQAVADGYDPKGYVMAEKAPLAYGPTVGANLKKTFEANTIDMLLDLKEVEFNGTWCFIQGTFASKRLPKAPSPGTEPRFHAGFFFTLLRKTDSGWKVWRNMDTSSPDANPLLEQLKGRG
ncbi:MAG: hypothetical protein FJX59_06715 [Alphaproteobacteria bacterium]|nr:hypothetical protein [Alphaproteobacteria bacterium]